MLIIAVANQIHEMDAIRRKLWELEQSQVGMKNKSVARGMLVSANSARYEAEIAALRRELEIARSGHPSMGGHQPPPPPQVGHGTTNHFGGIMAGGASQGGPALAPPPQEPAQPQGLPGQLASGQGPPGSAPGLPQPPAFGGNFAQPPSANGEHLSVSALPFSSCRLSPATPATDPVSWPGRPRPRPWASSRPGHAPAELGGSVSRLPPRASANPASWPLPQPHGHERHAERRQRPGRP
jgi:general transcriptional corepressor TUP1